MRIRELVGSTEEPEKRNTPDVAPVENTCTKSSTKIAEPVKSGGSAALAKIDHTDPVSDVAPAENACTKSSNYGTAAFTKIAEPVKSGGSAAFAKIDLTDPVSVEDVNATPVKNGGAAFARIRKAVATPMKSSSSYGFVTFFAKIGYTVRVKGVYRIVPWISEDTETIITVYPTSFPQNTHDDKLIHGQDVGTPVRNDSRNFYKFDFLIFARIGYIVRVKCLNRIGQWMADPETKARIKMYITILAKNAHKYAIRHNFKFVPGKVAVVIILANTLADILLIELSKEKAGSQEQHLSGSQDFIPGVEMHGEGVKSASNNGNDWFSAAYKILKDIFGVIPLTEILVFMTKEFRAFLRKEPFRSRIFSKGFLTMESLAFMMREFFVFMMKQLFGVQFISHIGELVVAVMGELFGIELVNESGFHGSATKGKNTKGMHKY